MPSKHDCVAGAGGREEGREGHVRASLQFAVSRLDDGWMDGCTYTRTDGEEGRARACVFRDRSEYHGKCPWNVRTADTDHVSHDGQYNVCETTPSLNQAKPRQATPAHLPSQPPAIPYSQVGRAMGKFMPSCCLPHPYPYPDSLGHFHWPPHQPCALSAPSSSFALSCAWR